VSGVNIKDVSTSEIVLTHVGAKRKKALHARSPQSFMHVRHAKNITHAVDRKHVDMTNTGV